MIRYIFAVFLAAGGLWGQCRVIEPGFCKSVLQVELAVDNGKLLAVRDADNEATPAAKTPHFKPSKEFSTTTLDDANKAEITKELLKLLTPVLDKMEPLYRYFLNDKQKALDDKRSFMAETAKVRSLTANSRQTVHVFETWAKMMDLDFGSTFQDILKHLPSLGLDAETPMFSTSFNADSGAAVGCFRVDDLVDPATLAEGRQALDVKFLPQPQPRKILLSKEEVVEWVHSEISGTSGFLAAE